MRSRCWKMLRAGRSGPIALRKTPVGVAVHDLGHVRVVVHAKLRGRRELAGFAVDEAVGQMQVERVAMAFEHVEAHVEAVVERGKVTADGEATRREHPVEAMIVLRIKPHQPGEAARQDVMRFFED